MPSQQDATTFTLSFSGVDFALEPHANEYYTAADEEGVLSIAKVTNEQVVIDFRNFSGVLRVANRDNREAAIGAGGVDSALLILPVPQTDENTTTEDNRRGIMARRNKNKEPVPDAVPEEEADSPQKQRIDNDRENKNSKGGGRQQTTLNNFVKETKVRNSFVYGVNGVCARDVCRCKNKLSNENMYSAHSTRDIVF